MDALIIKKEEEATRERAKLEESFKNERIRMQVEKSDLYHINKKIKMKSSY